LQAVADSSAILAFLFNEPGGSLVKQYAGKLFVSSVNLAEVASKLSEQGFSESAAEEAIAVLALEVIAFDTMQALACGKLRAATMSAGLSIGDRACIVLGIIKGLPVLTADRIWAKIETGAKIEFIR
jgi:PIN domain nuclease of toxin-antitoxin system